MNQESSQVPTEQRSYLNIVIGNPIIQIRYIKLRPCFDGRGPTTLTCESRGDALIGVHIVLPRRLRRLHKPIRNRDGLGHIANLRNRKPNRMKTNTLAAAYGAGRFPARLGRRRAGPGPEARPRPLVLAEADFLLFFIISSSVISRAADMFGCEKQARNGIRCQI